jgi:pimeloyl-ACP methyl ester carboxylesterase
MRKKRILNILLYTFLGGLLLLLIAFGVVWQEFGPVDESGLAGEKIRDPELSADFFYPKGGKSLPVILAMDGSGGGFIPFKYMQLLALEGYAVLSVAYFKAPGRPEKLEEIPLEYFERAMRRIGRHPAVDSTRIIVLGVSRGAELALLLASQYPQIKGVVAFAPGCFILPSDTKSPGGRFTRSSWTRAESPSRLHPSCPSGQRRARPWPSASTWSRCCNGPTGRRIPSKLKRGGPPSCSFRAGTTRRGRPPKWLPWWKPA